MKLRTKLVGVTAIPLVLALGLGAMIVYGRAAELGSARAAVSRLRVLSHLSGTLAELQKERGKSSLFLSGGIGKGELMDQRLRSDSAYASRVEALKAEDGAEALADQIVGALSILSSLRASIDERSILGNSAFAEYTQPIDLILSALREAALGASPEYTGEFSTILLLEEAKEFADRTRAKASTMAAFDSPLSDEALVEVISDWNAVRHALFSAAIRLDGEQAIMRADVLSSSEWAEMDDAILVLARKGDEGRFGLDGAGVFASASAVIDRVQAIIDVKNAQASAFVEKEVAADLLDILVIGGAVAVGVAVLLVLSLVMLSSVMRRVRSLSVAFHDVARGEGDLTKCLDEDARDEIGELACDFNAFSGSLRDTVVAAKGAAKGLAADMDELAANMNETAGAVQEIAATIESIKQQALSQGAGVTEASATVEEIAKRVGTLVRAVERQSESLAASSASIEEMVASVRSVAENVERMGEGYAALNELSGTGREAVARASAKARDIEERSETLQDANALIAGIAARTNLLAMNAAIEAAHAGEAGRGFAVVADEIRKLAESAASQSKTVARDIHSIRGVIGEVVDAAAGAESGFADIVELIARLTRFEEEVKFALREQNAGSAQVLSALADMNGLAREVRSESDRMREGSAEVLAEMRRLLQMTAELENGMNEMAAGASQIRTAAAATNELAYRATESVRGLSVEMEKFKTEAEEAEAAATADPSAAADAAVPASGPEEA